MADGGTTTTDLGGRAYPATRLLAILMAMNVVAYLDRSILSLAAPAVQADLGLSHVQLSSLLGIGFVLSFAMLGIPSGWLVDRAPRRWIVAAGILVWSLAASGAGLARSFGALLAARIGVGAGEATLHPAAYSMITDSVPPRRLGLALTLYGGSSGLGAALSVALGGLLLTFAIGHGAFTVPLIGTVQPWQFVLLLSGLPGLILAATIFLVPEPARRDTLTRWHDGVPATTAAGFGPFVRGHRRFLTCAILGFSVFQIVTYGFALWQPTYMVRRFGWSYAETGLALSIGMAAAFAGSLAAGWIVDRMIARGRVDAPLRWSAASVLVTGAAISTAFLVDDPYLCIGLVIVGQLPVALIGVVSTALQQVTPNEFRGRISAIYLLAANLIGFGLGPFLPAALTDYVFGDEASLGLAIAITALVASPIAALLLWLGCAPMRRGVVAAAAWRDGGTPVAPATD